LGVTLIIVSNRVANPASSEPIEGGLASALARAVSLSGALWIGTRVRPGTSAQKKSLASLESAGKGTIGRVDLPADLYREFYEGFANSGLWPVLHSRPDLVRTTHEDYAAYRHINRMMAQAIASVAPDDGRIWVHDYHFLAVAEELRRLEVEAPVGFFLHTPFPMRSAFHGLPRHRDLVMAMLQYRLIGFQTETDKLNFADYVRSELNLTVIGGSYVPQTGTQLGAFPIGIDTSVFADGATRANIKPDMARLRSSLNSGKLVIGVDRIDYSKGLDNRLRAIDLLLQSRPELKRQVSLLQIAVPSRCGIETYSRLQADLAARVGEINGRHGEIDWTPIRYLTKGYPQSVLAGLYRNAQVGLVTPLYDGMNLVAKEYLAAQDPNDPGVLVLSEFAGSARQLDSALLVNPHDIDDIAAAIRIALAMPVDERRARWRPAMDVIEREDIHGWFADFMTALDRTGTPIPVRPQSGIDIPISMVGSGESTRAGEFATR
jgi:trehalose 6-phosphate synthase